MYGEETLRVPTVQERDDAPFAELFRTEYSTVYRYFYYRTGSRTMSEDLTQETFVRAYRAFDRFDPSRASAATWLFTIGRSVYVDEWRRTGRHVYAEEEVPESVIGAESPESDLCRRETNAALYRAMAMLSARERHLIALKYAAGLRNREIAGLFGKSERHTAVLLCRTLKKLRKILEKEGVYAP